MTVTVFVWMPIGSLSERERAVGHASLHLATKRLYISFWPESNKAARAVGHNMGADLAFESARLPDYASAPIAGLDEEAIAGYWKTLKVGRRTAPYHGGEAAVTSRSDADLYNLVSRNCSTVVMNCLIAGGALNNPRVRSLYENQTIISPIDIRQIAEILGGECGSIGGAKFPVGDALIDRARNAASNTLRYGEYLTKANIGDAIDKVSKRLDEAYRKIR